MTTKKKLSALAEVVILLGLALIVVSVLGFGV